MHDATPGRSWKGAGSTGPSLPTMPMAMRVSEGMGRGWKPISTIWASTAAISAAVACWFMTISIGFRS